MLAVKSRKTPENQFFSRKKIEITNLFLHLSSSYAKILGGELFRTREIPRSGSKAKTEKKRKREKDRTIVITMAKLHMAHASTHGARKPLSLRANALSFLRRCSIHLVVCSSCDPSKIGGNARADHQTEFDHIYAVGVEMLADLDARTF